MLTRLKLTLPELLSAYIGLSKKIFQSIWGLRTARFVFTPSHSKFRRQCIETPMKKIIERVLGDSDASLIDQGDETACKGFVVAVERMNLFGGPAQLFRTYKATYPEDEV